MCGIDRPATKIIKYIIMYSVQLKNYNKRRPEILKNIADLGLLVAMIVEIVPEFPGRQWVVFAGIGFKLVTKFISEHPRP